jgi:hypothetical protein
MPRSEFNRRYLTSQEFSLGPLRWRSTSVHEAGESDSSDIENPLQTFVERLHVLIQQARKAGCTSQELNTILSQHIPGDHHVDA